LYWVGCDGVQYLSGTTQLPNEIFYLCVQNNSLQLNGICQENSIEIGQGGICNTDNDCMPSPTPTRTQTKTPTVTATNTSTNTPTNTPSVTPTNTPTNTNTPSVTPTNTPSVTPTNTNTTTNTPTNTSTPTNTPTNPCNIVPCSVYITIRSIVGGLNPNLYQLYAYNPSTNTLTDTDLEWQTFGGAVNIAASNNKLWRIITSSIYEYDIVGCSFVYNREIYLGPGNNIANTGGVAINDTTLLITFTADYGNIYELDISVDPPTWSQVFSLPAGRDVMSFILTTDGCLIVTNRVIGQIPPTYITQINYATGEIQSDFAVPDVGLLGLFGSNGDIYAIEASSGNIYQVNLTFPYGLTLINQLPPLPPGANNWGGVIAQPYGCATGCLLPPTPTPTNTVTPTNTPSNTATNTPSVTPTNTNTPTNTATPTNTPTPSTSRPDVSQSPTPTPTNTPSVTPTITETPTQTPTNTPSNTATNTPTQTNTPSNTATNTPTQTNTPSSTVTNTPSATQTNTPSSTVTNTPSTSPPSGCPPPAECYPQQSTFCLCYSVTNNSAGSVNVDYTQCSQAPFPIPASVPLGPGQNISVCSEDGITNSGSTLGQVTIITGCYCCPGDVCP
jgi:hypothetical protein